MFATELQSEQVQTHPQKFAPTLALKWYRQDLIVLTAKQSCLTLLQPTRIKVADVFSACTFPVWPAKRRVLQWPVCHLAACLIVCILTIKAL